MIIGFIGLGKLGMPCAEAIAKKNYQVIGYDIEQRRSDLVDVVPTIEDCVRKSNLIFIAVPTPHNDLYDGSMPTSMLEPVDFNYSIVKDILKEAVKYMDNDKIIVLISTVLPGTIRSQLISLIGNCRFVYNPYLIAMGSVATDMINPEMVMIGTQDGTETGDAKVLIDFYKTIMENDPRYVVGTWDECECIKVFYNTFISAKIGLVNMIQDVAEKQGNINVDVVTDALAKSTMRIMGPQYMKAGMGDGGACHPRDNIALRFLAKKLDLGYDLFDSIMSAREIQAQNLALELIKHAQHNNYGIYIHGKAYKPKVPYTDGSYSLLIGHYCEISGYPVKYIDPYTGDVEYPLEPAVFLLAHAASVTYNYIGKATKDDLYCEIPAGSVVIDPWRKFVDSDCKVIHYGNTRNRSTNF